MKKLINIKLIKIGIPRKLYLIALIKSKFNIDIKLLVSPHPGHLMPNKSLKIHLKLKILVIAR